MTAIPPKIVEIFGDVELPKKFYLDFPDFPIYEQDGYDICTPDSISECVSLALKIHFGDEIPEEDLPLSPQPLIEYTKLDPNECFDYVKNVGLNPVKKFSYIGLKDTISVPLPTGPRYKIEDVYVYSNKALIDYVLPRALVKYKLPVFTGVHARGLENWREGDLPFKSGITGCSRQCGPHHALVARGFDFDSAHPKYHMTSATGGVMSRCDVDPGELLSIHVPFLYESVEESRVY